MHGVSARADQTGEIGTFYKNGVFVERRMVGAKYALNLECSAGKVAINVLNRHHDARL